MFGFEKLVAVFELEIFESDGVEFKKLVSVFEFEIFESDKLECGKFIGIFKFNLFESSSSSLNLGQILFFEEIKNTER